MDDTDDLLDYCARCVRECGRSRMETLTTPDAIHWSGGGSITAYYECFRGHEWRCFWSAALWFDADVA
jgi:hypothetical protein